MRQFLLLSLFLVCSLFINAQTPGTDTSESEDIYELYADSIFKGDNRVIEMGDYKVTNYRFHFTEVYRNPDQGLVGIIVKAFSGVSGRTYFLAIPIPGNDNNYSYNAELAELLEKIATQLDDYMTAAFLTAFIRYYGDHRDLGYQMGINFYSGYKALEEEKIRKLKKQGVETDKSEEEIPDEP
ncbi:MAG: hypothetical protein WD077_03720 [Bacteroidia bacterium]